MREFMNLAERAQPSMVNSMGRPIAFSEEAMVNFWNWFGASKVRDKLGRPLVVFHGTDADFRAFDPSMSNVQSNTGVPRGAFVFSDHAGVSSSYSMAQYDVQGWRDEETTQAFRDIMKTGTWEDQLEFLAQHPSGYDDYKDGGNVMPVYLKMLKPLIVDAKGDHWNMVHFQPKDYRSPEEFSTNEIAQVAMEEGYDGCIIRNVKDVSKGPTYIATTYFVFRQNQIKSALTNTGAYADHHDITEGEDEHPWTTASAQAFVSELSSRVQGYDLEIVGGIVRRGYSDKDVDILLKKNAAFSDPDEAADAMEAMGARFQGRIEKMPMEGWFLPDGRRVDFFYAEKGDKRKKRKVID